MSDIRPEPIQITKRSGGKRKLVIAVVLLALLGGGGFGGLTYINSTAKNLVVQELQNISERASAAATKNGATASLTYDSIEMTGGVVYTTAIIKSPRFTYNRPTLFGAEERSSISTASAQVDLASLKTKQISVTLPDPVLVNTDGEDRFQLSSPTAPRVLVGSSTVEGMAVTRRELKIPSGITLTSFKAGENGADRVVNITYEADHSIVGHSSEDGSFEDAVISFTNLKLAAEDETLDLGSFSFASTEKTSAENVQKFSLSMGVNDLNYKTPKRTGGPYSLAVKMSGDYAQKKADNVAEQMNLSIEEFSLGGKDYKATLKGQLLQSENDPLPSGSGDVAATGLDVLAGTDVLGAYKDIALSVLEQINGAPPADLTEVTFSITREPMGTVIVGQTTFEQLVGLVLTKAATLEPAAPASQVTGESLPAEPSLPVDTTSPVLPPATEAPAAAPAPAMPAAEPAITATPTAPAAPDMPAPVATPAPAPTPAP